MIAKLAALAVGAAAVLAIAASRAGAQDGLKAGDLAPDFTLHGATHDGVMAKPITLSELRGQVVVLAFFPKARTKG